MRRSMYPVVAVAISDLVAVALRLYVTHRRMESSTADLLRPLPGVVQVEAAVHADQPTHRIVHLRDWHFVPKNLHAFDSPASDRGGD